MGMAFVAMKQYVRRCAVNAKQSCYRTALPARIPVTAFGPSKNIS